MQQILEAKHINKYFEDPVKINVLSDVSMHVNKGEFVAVTGKSGCGKSTLLYILSTMDTDYSGTLTIDGETMTGRSGTYLARIRNEKIGFVFQFHYLLNEFTVLRNVMLPALKLGRRTHQECEYKAMECLVKLGIEKLALKNARNISGGEKQRVAIARAMINDPLIIMADEPTGNLDKKNSSIVLEIFERMTKEFAQTLLVVTHDPSFAAQTGRVIKMEDGRIVI
jgi:lipoprotein-releasing system ATP-binding protein